ncbi:MAG: C1 family peptidase [Candidatus Zixiibacteriota bacterium]
MKCTQRTDSSTIFFTVILALIALSFWSSAAAQVDINALQEQAEEEGWTFTVGENSATQYSLEELCGLVEPENWAESASFDPCTPTRVLPSQFDWRDSTTLPPVKNQGGCGSCWAFATVGPLECNIKLKDGSTVDLSEQWLVSCNSDGWDCSGGWWAHNYHEWKTDGCGGTGTVYESDFPYAASDLPCGCPYPHEYLIESWAYVGSQSSVPSVSSIKQAILDHGPISVAVTSNYAMQAYNGGIFNSCTSSQVNHGVTLVGWDDSQGTNGVWYMRNSWGQGWGEDGGYMRIEYGCSNIGYAASYVDYAGRQKLSFTYPNGLPETVMPGQPTPVDVVVSGIYNGTPSPGSGQVHYSIDGQAVVSVDMEQSEPNYYTAMLPAIDCGSDIEFYFSAEDISASVFTDPFEAPEETFSVFPASVIRIALTDNFDTDEGWSVSGDAADGHWDRGVPVGGGDRGDPAVDFDGSGSCYLTDNEDDNSDVDLGTTTLISPVIDLSSGDATVHYARWYSNDLGGNPHENLFYIYISNDDGQNWAEVEAVGPVEQASGGWYESVFQVSDFVTPTPQIRLRFDVPDTMGGSVVEAALDDVTVIRYECGEFVCGDANGSGSVDIDDGVFLVQYIFSGGAAPEPAEVGDVDCSTGIDIDDVVYLIGYIFAGGAAPCSGCQ